MRLLLVDNYDSYTFNLYQLFAGLVPTPPTVVRNDAYAWPELSQGAFDAIVLSPGPGHPARQHDFGVCSEIIRNASLPVLGVCLGHQGIACVHGGTVARAREPMHGRITPIHHQGDPLFEGIPSPFLATRYHSLCVQEPLPSNLEAIAWDDDGFVMALREIARPVWGVQFHPESIGTPVGSRLASNFLHAVTTRSSGQASSVKTVLPSRAVARRASAPPKLTVRRIGALPDAAVLFDTLFGSTSHCFWLDSSRVENGLARFSFLGTAAGPYGQFVTYDVTSRTTSVQFPKTGLSVTHSTSIFDYLDEQLEQLAVAEDLPFDLQAGFVGYLSYELKAVCGGSAAHCSPLPDAQLLLADRIVVLDQLEGVTYTLTLEPADQTGEDAAEAGRWHDEARAAIEHSTAADRLNPVIPPSGSNGIEPLEFTLRRGQADYQNDIKRCQELIRRGESYEICLTNMLHSRARLDPVATYRTLRFLNPAPYASFLRFGDVSVLSSSPERFLTIGRDRVVEAKPIKGTRARAGDEAADSALREELRTSAKDRAENLMIVDLLRNDIGLVCETGSVTVPALMAVESYATVHQLVSTVRGRLRDDVTVGDCVRACFPGGSMTGAPKKRTMEIIDELEPGPRGIYSGAIGFFGANGTADLSIVIRTAVVTPRGVSIGSGGAITALSDPSEELDELLLKATVLLEAISWTVTGGRENYAVRDPRVSHGGPHYSARQ